MVECQERVDLPGQQEVDTTSQIVLIRSVLILSFRIRQLLIGGR